jgi:hypothetical protein
MKGLTLYQNKKVSWNWLSIQVLKGSPKLFHWHISINRPYKQWFSYCSIFPLYFTKNNSHWEFGISLIFFRIQIKYQF